MMNRRVVASIHLCNRVLEDTGFCHMLTLIRENGHRKQLLLDPYQLISENGGELEKPHKVNRVDSPIIFLDLLS